jgi:multidrug efflux pump subunit AcrB
MLSLFAGTHIGIVVDDAIVVVENVSDTSPTACRLATPPQGDGEGHAAVIAIAFGLSVRPDRVHSRITRQFYRQFALTIAV